MKKIVFALCAPVIFVSSALAQVTGFSTTGSVQKTAKKIGVTIVYSDDTYPNGGKKVTVEYGSFDTAGQSVQEVAVDSFISNDGSESTLLMATGFVVEGSQDISGANTVVATESEIVITRYLPNDGDPETAVKTQYTFTKEKAVRDVLFADGRTDKEQVLP